MMIEVSQKEQIYSDYCQKVTNYVRGKISNHADAEDIVSEVFLKVYGKIDTYDEQKSSLSTWIYHITQNTVIDYYRTRRVFEDIPEELPDDENTEDEMVNEEMLEYLANGLEQLNEKEKNIIILHYYKEISLKDIADKLEISYIYAKVLHKKALEKLNKFLNQ